MSGTLSIRNRQRVRRINTPLLRRITLHVIRKQLGLADFELGVHLVDATEMARINWDFLQHEGSTDVITFDHSASSGIPSLPHESHQNLHGEVFISIDDAVNQARQFRTTWQQELIRYVIHGLLHLKGHDDLKPAARRVMKREENRLARVAAKQFALAQLGRDRSSRDKVGPSGRKPSSTG
jgi:probable rRNA maturation factor